MMRMKAAATSTPTKKLISAIVRTSSPRRGNAQRQEVGQVGQAHGHRGDADGGEAARADRLDGFGDATGLNRLKTSNCPAR